MMLTGENVRLRAVEKEDLKELARLKNEEEVRLNLVSGIPQPVAFEAELYSYGEKVKVKHPDELEFAIETKDGKVIGECGTKGTDWKNSTTSVHIFIGGDGNLGKGYGTEALCLLVDFIFMEMNLNRIQLLVFGFNKRAIKCYEKVGFRHEGALRRWLYRNGIYHDGVQMAILRRDYDELRRK